MSTTTNSTTDSAANGTLPAVEEVVQVTTMQQTVTSVTPPAAGAPAADETPIAYMPGSTLKPSNAWPPPIFMDMAASDQEKFYMEHRWYSQWKWYDKRAGSAKKNHQLLQLIVGIGSVSVPVLVGFSVPSDLVFLGIGAEGLDTIKLLATVGISLAVAISSAIESVMKPGDNWRNFRGAAEELQREKSMYDVRSGPYRRSRTPFLLFSERCENIIAKQNGQWLQMGVNDDKDDKGQSVTTQKTVTETTMASPYESTTDYNSSSAAG